MTEMAAMHGDHQCRLLTRRDVLELVQMSKSTLHRKVARGEFPRPIRTGLRMVRWWLCEVMAWLASLPRA